MATNSPLSSRNSPGLNVAKRCLCGLTKPAKTLWIQCTSPTCEHADWHAVCAGFDKPRQSTMNSIGDWCCPYCSIAKLPLNKKSVLDDFLETLSNKIDTLKEELQKEIYSQKETYADMVKKNQEERHKKNQEISAISQNISTMKTNIMDKLDSNLEKQERERKANNICIFNVPESTKTTLEESYQEDVEHVKYICEKVEIKKEDVRGLFRIGKTKRLSKPRPIILKLTNEEKKSELLKLRDLKIKDQNIYIHPDRTKKEQEDHRLLVSQLRERRERGEENLGIRNGKIMTILPFRKDPQLFWG